MSFSKATVQLPKYQQVVEAIKNEILSGRYQPGQKLPSEAALVKRFRGIQDHGRSRASRTAAGWADSKSSGIGKLCGPPASGDEGLLFGLLIPNLGDTEIFGPICQGMSQAPQARKNALLWGNIAAGCGDEGRADLAALPTIHRKKGRRCLLCSTRANSCE